MKAIFNSNQIKEVIIQYTKLWQIKILSKIPEVINYTKQFVDAIIQEFKFKTLSKTRFMIWTWQSKNRIVFLETAYQSYM